MSLADKISGLLSTTPASFDPDEEDADAKLTERDPADLENDVTTSEHRKRNVDLLEDVDVKYAGTRSSRKDMAQRDWDSDTDDVPSSENDNDNTDSEAESGESHEASMKVEHINITPVGVIQVHTSDTSSEFKKGCCVRNQLSIWENLLEIRIQLQKCLLTANKMPQTSTFNDIKTQSGEAFTGKVAETRKSISSTLDKLLHLQELLLKQHPETKTNVDEKIQSDSDASEVVPDTSGEEQEEEKMERPKKRRKIVHYEKTIAADHEKYKGYRNSVIQKWYDKTRIGVATMKSGNSTMHSILDQIEYHLVETKDKLRKRTQMKRSDYAILGEPRGDDEYNLEIFDDDDFYHQLLRELIEVKSVDVTDPVQLGQQWIRLQSLRSKMKRKIDTKATKGRKVRYTVHAKLVNFMAPIDEGSAWTDEAKTELFGSLFGKSQTK